MGCLNSTQSFAHWFGNVHLSGPCNRSCYFCIGQHMMALDGENTLSAWPLPGLDDFLSACKRRRVRDVFVTGTNTDPLMFASAERLSAELRSNIPGARVGIRTNAAALRNYEQFLPYEMGSVTICSFNLGIYRAMMGSGAPPNIRHVVQFAREARWHEDPKVNVVLGPENLVQGDIFRSIEACDLAGVRRINLREPYGQPHVGNPLEHLEHHRVDDVHGMPTYLLGNAWVTYWDVHYCEVESVNLYASGRVSEDYPITRGHAEGGDVRDQSNFKQGRHNEQWVTLRRSAREAK